MARQAVCVLRGPDDPSHMTAEQARLLLSSDCEPGFRRLPARSGGFTYQHDDGRTATADEVARIEALKIPPAWTDVWICADEHGHLQATGRDARGRKQYRYHERWRTVRDETKYERMTEFGDALSGIRQRVDEDLRRPLLDRPRVLALVVAVLDATLIRVGNREYARDNDSFGLTTLRDEHAEVTWGMVRLRFRGKAGKELAADIKNPRIARALARTRDLPGQELFQYRDEAGEPRVIGSGDVNDYLRDLSGMPVTSKDFRTWGGSLVFACALQRDEASAPTDRAVTAAVREAAHALGNTPAVCRRSYIHPRLVELYREGSFSAAWERADGIEPAQPFLSEDERIFLGVLRTLNHV